MAQKQSVPRIAGSHLDDKFRQSAAKIAGKGRRTLFSATDLTNGATTGSDVEALRKTLAAKFFQSVGDCIFITFGGILSTSGAPATLTINLLNEAGALLTTAFTGTFNPGVVQASSYFGQCCISLNSDKDVNSFGGMVIVDVVTPIFSTAYGSLGVTPLEADRLIFQVLLNSDLANGATMSYLLVEFCPAAIT